MWSRSSLPTSVARLSTPNCDSMRLSQAGLRRGEDRRDAQPAQEREEARVVVDEVEVVEHDEEAPVRVAGAQPPEGLADLAQALRLRKIPLSTSAWTS